MTWLSRLLPKTQLHDRRANDYRGRIRHGIGRRRFLNLDTLETRTVLSAGNVTVAFSLTGPPANLLTITGDTHNDTFTVTEGASGIVTVTGTSAGLNQTTINGTSAAYVSPHAVQNIVIDLPGSGNTDTVSIVGLGAGKPTLVHNLSITSVGPSVTSTGPYVKLGVTGVDNNGSFTGSFNNSQLTATLTGSSFSTLSIDQTGCCPASVTLTSDTVPGTVAVTEGNANGDSITASKDTFGSTTLTQGNPSVTMPGCTGAGDTVSVTASAVKDLTVCQPLSGGGQSIDVDTVTVSLTSFGVKTYQGDGGGDTTTVNAITASGVLPNNWQYGPPSICIVQGNGGGDMATASNSVLPGNISICQGNGDGDMAMILGDTIGIVEGFGPYAEDYFGCATITQGTGKGDVAVLNGDAVNNVTIYQAATVAPGTICAWALNDVAEINDTTVTSDICITQGCDDAAVGNNIVAIGYDYLGVYGSSPVTAGYSTAIYQYGANNSVVLGDPSGISSFSTGYLDIYTGAGGGGLVVATDTSVAYGALGLFSPYTIDGGNDSSSSITNMYDDNGGNSGITISDNYNYEYTGP